MAAFGSANLKTLEHLRRADLRGMMREVVGTVDIDVTNVVEVERGLVEAVR